MPSICTIPMLLALQLPIQIRLPHSSEKTATSQLAGCGRNLPHHASARHKQLRHSPNISPHALSSSASIESDVIPPDSRRKAWPTYFRPCSCTWHTNPSTIPTRQSEARLDIELNAMFNRICRMTSAYNHSRVAGLSTQTSDKDASFIPLESDTCRS